MVLAVQHFSAYGIAVYMHIQRTHKYGDLDSSVGKIFIGLYFLNYHYSAIAGSDKGIFLVSKLPFWYAEKGY